jgi:hypothetical protein
MRLYGRQVLVQFAMHNFTIQGAANPVIVPKKTTFRNS